MAGWFCYTLCKKNTANLSWERKNRRERLQTITLEHVEWDLPQVAQRAVEAAERGQMVLCVMNTIDKAQKLYRLVKSRSCAKISEGRIGLLHSRFPAWRRTEIEEKWLNVFGKGGDRSSGAILISTQVVEQSVDIDADLLITELAPTDMLFQRIGRLWRHIQNVRRATQPRVVILYPPAGNEPFVKRIGDSAFVYSPYVLWRSAEVWRIRETVNIPSEIRILLEATYRPGNETGEPLKMANDMTEKMNKMKGLAEGITSGGLPLMPDRNELFTRYNNAPSVSILILTDVRNCKNATVFLGSGDKVTLKGPFINIADSVAFHRNTVTIRKKSQDKSWRDLAEQSEPLYNAIQEYYYEEMISLLRDSETGRLLTLRRDETPLFYSDELGIFRKDIFESGPIGQCNPTDHEEDDNNEWCENGDW